MRAFRKRTRLVAVVAVGALGLAACGGDDEAAPAQTENTDTTTDTTSETMPPTETPSSAEQGTTDPYAALREADQYLVDTAGTLAGGIAQATQMEGDTGSSAAKVYTALTQLLQEHVYFAGFAVDAAYSFGLDSPQFEAAAATLDENSVALSELIGSVDQSKQQPFLDLWRQHIGFFVDYAKAVKGGDDAAKQQALDDLKGYENQSAAFFNELSGGVIPQDAVKTNLREHVATLTAAIDAFAGQGDRPFAKLKEAADFMDTPAKALAGGIVEATGMDGDVESPAATTNATLTGLLQEHVILAGLAVREGYGNGLDSDVFAAAADTLDANSVELSELVGSVAGDEKQQAFLDLWRQHIGFFVDYATGAATGDQALEQQALDELAQYREQSGAFFEQVTGGALPASAVKEELVGHVETLTSAIDALAAALVSQ